MSFWGADRINCCATSRSKCCIHDTMLEEMIGSDEKGGLVEIKRQMRDGKNRQCLSVYA